MFASSCDGTYYKVNLKSSLGDMGTREMYMKDSHFNWLTDSAGLKINLIKNNDGVFMIHPKQRFIAKYPKGSNRGNHLILLPGPIGDVNVFLQTMKANKVGEETVDKKKCTIYKYDESESGWKCKLWVDTKNLKPVKMLMEAVKSENNITVTYEKYDACAKISDDKFKPPKGIPIKDMPDKKENK
ncbi:MAG: hypothetical protein SNJ70_02280 [Armatimonadota bacterium]